MRHTEADRAIGLFKQVRAVKIVMARHEITQTHVQRRFDPRQKRGNGRMVVRQKRIVPMGRGEDQSRRKFRPLSLPFVGK